MIQWEIWIRASTTSICGKGDKINEIDVNLVNKIVFEGIVPTGAEECMKSNMPGRYSDMENTAGGKLARKRRNYKTKSRKNNWKELPTK